MKKENYANKVFALLKELHKDHPTWEIARHIAQATADYDNIWGIPDKELYNALYLYKQELCIEDNEEDIDKLIADSKDLESLLAGDEEEENEY